MSRVLEKIAREDPRVVDFSNESDGRGGDDGYWFYLAPGWYWDDPGLHSVHEWNVRDMLRAYRSIRPCDCVECRKAGAVAIIEAMQVLAGGPP